SGVPARPAGGRVQRAGGCSRASPAPRRRAGAERAHYPSFSQTTGGMIRKPKAIVIMAIVAAALALGGVAVPLTSHPRFCASCHNIKPSYDSWVVSTHKDVTCVDCHVRPTLEGYLNDKVKAGLKDVAMSVFGTPTDAHNLQATVHTEVCLSCHRAILRVSEVAVRDLPPPVQKVGLVMSHRKHIEAFAKRAKGEGDRKSTRLNSSHDQISYAVFCLKKKRPQRPSSTNASSSAPNRLNRYLRFFGISVVVMDCRWWPRRRHGRKARQPVIPG